MFRPDSSGSRGLNPPGSVSTSLSDSFASLMLVVDYPLRIFYEAGKRIQSQKCEITKIEVQAFRHISISSNTWLLLRKNRSIIIQTEQCSIWSGKSQFSQVHLIQNKKNQYTSSLSFIPYCSFVGPHWGQCKHSLRQEGNCVQLYTRTIVC